MATVLVPPDLFPKFLQVNARVPATFYWWNPGDGHAWNSPGSRERSYSLPARKPNAYRRNYRAAVARVSRRDEWPPTDGRGAGPSRPCSWAPCARPGGHLPIVGRRPQERDSAETSGVARPVLSPEMANGRTSPGHARSRVLAGPGGSGCNRGHTHVSRRNRIAIAIAILSYGRRIAKVGWAD